MRQKTMDTLKYELCLENTRARLREWGRWCNAVLTMGLGFPRLSILGKIAESNGELIKGTAKKLAPENEMAEKIDDLVNQLSKQAPEKAKILYIHYADKGSIKSKTSKLNLSKKTYFKYLLCAENWIHDRIH